MCRGRLRARVSLARTAGGKLFRRRFSQIQFLDITRAPEPRLTVVRPLNVKKPLEYVA